MFHVHFKRMYIMLLWGEMLSENTSEIHDLVCHLRLLFSCWFSVWNVTIDANEVFKSSTMTVLLSVFPSQDLLYIFRCSYFGCITVYKGYILLLDCSLCHYVVPFLSLTIPLILKSILSEINIATIAFFFLFICMRYLFPSLYFYSVWSRDLGGCSLSSVPRATNPKIPLHPSSPLCPPSARAQGKWLQTKFYPLAL